MDLTQCSPFKIYRKYGVEQRETDGDNREMQATNAFGQMEFVGGESKTRAKYIRLSDKTDFHDITALMEKSWGLKRWPKIVISVIGGVHNFAINSHINNRLKEEIHKLCLNVAGMPTETWVITKGTDCGVTKLVAEAMQGNKYKNTFVIGVTLWENLSGNEDLVQRDDLIKIPRYSIKKETMCLRQTDNKYYLNKDHTHFFLVDTPPNDKNCTEKEIAFRHQLVRYIISRQLEELGDTNLKFGPEEIFVPAIQLVINGGLRTLSQIKQNLYPEDGGQPPVIIPVVVVAETGRVADWLTFGVENDVERLNELQDNIKKIFPQNFELIIEDIKLCLQRKQFITIYHPSKSQSLEDTIVRSFVKTRRQRNDSYITFDQLKMTMRWGREDIAEEEFVKVMSDKNVESPQIIEVMKELLLGALREQKMNFFGMILRVCFDIRMFDKHMLINLYRHVYLKDEDQSRNVLYTFLKPPTVAENEMVNSDANQVTVCIPAENQILNDIRKEINNLLSIKVVNYYSQETFEMNDPEKELFLWAVLCNKQQVAIASWKHGDDPIAKALIARKMYNEMAKRYKKNHPFFDDLVHKSLKKHARYFEYAALNLLEKSSLVSSSQAKELMEVQMPRWVDKTCMDLAALSNFEQFIAHQRCQDIIDLTWRGNFSLYGRYLNAKVILSVIFPLLIFFFKFQETYRHKDKFCCSAKSSVKKFVCTARSLVFDKVYAFYNAPVTKFWRNAGIHLSLLLTFVYVVLNKLESKTSFLEYVLLVIIVAYGMDKFRSIIQHPGISFCQKVRSCSGDMWNNIDYLTSLAFFVGFILRHIINTSSTFFIFSHIFYILAFLLCTVRLLKVISLHGRIGVYVFMLKRMIGDVKYFVAIILVFVLGYGVARTSILYPEEELTLAKFIDIEYGKKIFVSSFFHVVGEMFLNTEITNINNKTIFETPMYNSYSEAFMLMLQFFYIVITNLLFINLLIAVFNNTYASVQEQSNCIWKWNYYLTVKEYQAESIFPAPLSILSNIVFFSKTILKNIMKSTRKTDKERQNGSYREFIPMTEYFEKDTHLNTLKQFENECLSKYLIERNNYIQKKYSNDGDQMHSQSKRSDAAFLLYTGNEKHNSM